MKLEGQLRAVIRRKHMSLRTEESYVGWYRRFALISCAPLTQLTSDGVALRAVFWHGKKHPKEIGEAEVEAFLAHLAVERKLAAVSQNLMS